MTFVNMHTAPPEKKAAATFQLKQPVPARYELPSEILFISPEAYVLQGVWKAQEGSVVLGEQQLLQALSAVYVFKNPMEIVTYLQKHTFLFSLLVEAWYKLTSYFPDATFFLDVVSDPEDSETDDVLFVLVAPQVKPEEALQSLHRLDTTWWLDALPRAMGKLCITLGA